GVAGARSATLGQIFGNEFPVHEVIEEGLHEVGAAVLEVEIVGVLPYIAGEERGLALRHRVDRVGRLGDFEAAAVTYQPRPAAAELGRRCLLELLLELVEPAEALLDRLLHLARRLPAAARPHAVPEEGVVPHLRRVVEDPGLGVVLGGSADDLFQRLTGERGVLHQLVQGRDIGRVVLAMVELERARRHMRLEAVLRIGQRRKFEGHFLPHAGAPAAARAAAVKTERLTKKERGLAAPVPDAMGRDVRRRSAWLPPWRRAWGSTAWY